jgi:drug/metabolite transporter (DMT)-like permease
MKVWIAVAITLVFWSSAFAGIREGLIGGYSPGHLVLLRFLSASVVFILYALWPKSKIRLPKKKDILPIVILGWIGISIYHISLTYGERTVAAGTASLLIAAAPAFTALIAAFVLKERLRVVGWIGMAIGFLGIALITFGTNGSFGVSPNALLVLVSAIATSIFFVYEKPLFARYSAVELTAYFTWAGTLPMLIFAPGLFSQMHTATLEATLSGVYIGVFPAAIAYVAWAIALANGQASKITSALYINPVLAIFIAWIWLGELPHFLSIVGGVIAIIGVIIVNIWGTIKETRPASSSSGLKRPNGSKGPNKSNESGTTTSSLGQSGVMNQHE